MKVKVELEIRLLVNTFLPREVSVRRTVIVRNHGREEAIVRFVKVLVLNFYGYGEVDYKLLLALFKTLRQTKVKEVDLSGLDGGVLVTFDRARFFLKGVET